MVLLIFSGKFVSAEEKRLLVMDKEPSFWTLNTDEITLELSEIHSNTFVCTVLDGPIIDMDLQKAKDIKIEVSVTQKMIDNHTEP